MDMLSRLWSRTQLVAAKTWLFSASATAVLAILLYVALVNDLAGHSVLREVLVVVMFVAEGLSVALGLSFAARWRPAWAVPVLLTLGYLGVSILRETYWLRDRPELTLNLAHTTIPVLLAFWFAWRFAPGVSARRSGDDGIGDSVEVAIRRVLDSDRFLSTLHTMLPRGSDDAEHGLDFVPFMLATIQRRRDRSESAALRWLIALVVTSTGLTVVVVAFGYAIVNDNSFGAAMLLARAAEHQVEMARATNLIVPSLVNNTAFERCCAASLDDIMAQGREAPSDDPRRAASDAIAELNVDDSVAGLSAVREALDVAATALARVGTGNAARDAAKLRATSAALASFEGDRAAAVRTLPTSVERLGAFLSTAEVEIGRSENRTSELIKRLAIGVMVTSFFLAIIRYIATVYGGHLAEIRQADQEDLTVRKLYVAIKCARGQPEALQAVLTAMLDGKGEGGGAGGAKASVKLDSGTTKLLNDLIKKVSSTAP